MTIPWADFLTHFCVFTARSLDRTIEIDITGRDNQHAAVRPRRNRESARRTTHAAQRAPRDGRLFTDCAWISFDASIPAGVVTKDSPDTSFRYTAAKRQVRARKRLSALACRSAPG